VTTGDTCHGNQPNFNSGNSRLKAAERWRHDAGMAISHERREELRKIAKDRVADLIENPESYGLDAENKEF